ncbi:MAG: hypothetical protein JSR54_06905 [Proteobacteria bacterium]|nr:hypothetical protein [Pseudomonadota bacterium]
MKPRLRKAWHLLRRRVSGRADRPLRLAVAKERWPNGARSPVVLMIDDLTNAWHGPRSEGRWLPGGDWGGGHADSAGAVAFLERELLREFPEVRTTFFVVAGAISAYTHHQPFGSARPLDADEASRAFFTALSQDVRYELAYHGYNHGSAAATTEQFLQEWRGFESVAAAVAQTRRGLEIFHRATGRTPSGGKYGGWDYNQFAGDAVSECGFRWWCRDWMPRDVSGQIDPEYYEPQVFGANRVIALPSTVHGHFWDPRQIATLLKHRQIISIEEHIAPLRPDGLVQTPNIVDDIQELRRLYRHLRGLPVWHATCGDIAAYVAVRESTLLHDVDADGFSLRYDGSEPAPALTLRIDATALDDGHAAGVVVTAPDGVEVQSDPAAAAGRRGCFLVTVPVVSGRYRVRSSPATRHRRQ